MRYGQQSDRSIPGRGLYGLVPIILGWSAILLAHSLLVAGFDSRGLL